jgi:pimeloyl-ACP methyl ester carboxylesterase
MRFASAGLKDRKPGQPVLVLEAGAGAGLDTWQPVFAQLAALSPVIAYDRRGIGKSAPDPERPTVRRVSQSTRSSSSSPPLHLTSSSPIPGAEP